MDPKHYSKYDGDTAKLKSKSRGQLTLLSTSTHLLPSPQSHSNSNSNKLIIDKSCSMLQNRQKTNISIRKNDKKPHQGKSANDLIKNKTSLIEDVCPKPCSANTNCKDCLENTRCGWCAISGSNGGGRCIEGAIEGPLHEKHCEYLDYDHNKYLNPLYNNKQNMIDHSKVKTLNQH